MLLEGGRGGAQYEYSNNLCCCFSTEQFPGAVDAPIVVLQMKWRRDELTEE